MPRLTVRLSDDIYRALKETAARRDVPMRQVVEESLEFAAIKSEEEAEELLALARERAALDEDEALELAVEETRETRDSNSDGWGSGSES